jgi:hypothetical protein
MCLLLLMRFGIAHLADFIADQIALLDCGQIPALELTARDEHLLELEGEYRLTIGSVETAAHTAGDTLVGAILLGVEPDSQLRQRVDEAFTARFDTGKTFD